MSGRRIKQIEAKRKSYQAGPETFSVTFNEEGFVSKITVRVAQRWCMVAAVLG